MRQTLIRMQDELKERGIRGRYTDPFNLHVTLAFIGEYGDPDAIMDILEETDFEPEPLRLISIEQMRDLLIGRMEDNAALSTYVKRLRRALGDHHIPFDRKHFFPHITLARRVSGLEEAVIDAEDVWMNVSGVSLMKSEQGRHGMVYTEIGRIDFLEEEDSEE